MAVSNGDRGLEMVNQPGEKDPADGAVANGNAEVNEDDKIVMKRELGLVSATALIVGTMIGSGIFVSPKGVLENTGSVGASLLIWLACGLLAMMGSISYAELGTLLPQSGGEYTYLRNGYGNRAGPVLAYLMAWTYLWVVRPSELAAVTLAFGEYVVASFIKECDSPEIISKLFAAAALMIITFVNCASVKLATGVQNVFTLAKLLAIVIIIGVGVVRLCQGHTEHLMNAFEGSTTNGFAYAVAFYQGLWAYDGWNNLNYVTEEVKNPYKNLPRAILIGIPLVTGLYLLVNVSYFTVMSPAELLASNAVAVTFADRTLGVMAWIMPVFVALSTFGAANGSCFSSGRLTYVAAREGHMVEILSMVHIKRITPMPALLFQAFLAILMVIPSDFDTLINYFSFTAWLFYGGTMLALIIMRFTMKDEPRPFKVPIIVPVIVFLASLYLVVAPIIDDPSLEYLYAVLFILAGLIFYIPFVYYKFVPKCMRPLTRFLQLLLQVAPSSYSDKDV